MREHLLKCRAHFVYAGVFSVFINLLLLVVPLYMLQVFDRVLTSRSRETLAVLAVLAVAALCVYLVLEILRERLLLDAGIALDGLTGPPALAGALESAAGPGDQRHGSGLRDVAALRAFLTGGGVTAFYDCPWLPVYVATIFVLEPRLGIVATGGALAILTVAYLNERLGRAPLAELRQAADRASAYIDAGVRNAEVVRALGMRRALTARWRTLHERVTEAQARGGARSAAITSIGKFTRLLVQVAMLTAAADLVIDGEATAGVMMAGTVLLARALAPVEATIGGWRGFVEARAAYARLDELLRGRRPSGETLVLPPPRGTLALERVAFVAPACGRPILRGVSLEVPAGRALGIIGPSGAGKSTLARLAAGVWPCSAGAVRIDGARIEAWPSDRLGPHLGYLAQDAALFAGTVAENIARLEEIDDETVVEAARRARAHEMIMRLPRGYDTFVGDGGRELSGGQRRRVALARALLGDPRLVVLDEPEAGLDADGERALRETLRHLREAAVTTVVISHRVPLLAEADLLLVLEDGAVRHFGPRDAVLAALREPSRPPTPYLIRGGRS